jgi:hypothetical protein
VVATAYHVIRNAHRWEQPIRLQHTETCKEVLLRVDDRVISINEKNDSAIVIFGKKDLQIITEPLPLAPEGKHLRPGVEIAWAGYPAVAPDEFCFFSGHVSCFLKKDGAYLVDGVAINGVSGGPAFSRVDEEVHFIGIVTGYIPNRVAGETLPGVCFVTSIAPFQEALKMINTLEEAKEKAGKEAEGPAAPPSGAAKQ